MKKFFVKALTVMLLIVCLLLSEISSMPVYAFEFTNGETILEESRSSTVDETSIMTETESDIPETDETIIETKIETELQTEIESKMETDIEPMVEDESETIAEVRMITGFVGLNAYDSRIDSFVADKPTLEELLDIMPKTLQVYLDDSNEITEINVDWFCVGEDYSGSSAHYFQFSPLFDEDKYILSENINLLTEAPYIGVFLEEGDGIASMAAANSSSNETQIFSFLINELDLNQAAASGILANIYCESAFNPNVSGDSGNSYGICQWYGSRKTNLINYCTQNGYDYNSLAGQLYFLKYEMENSYKTIYNYMLNNIANTEAGAYEAGYYWCYNFEIPANTENTSIVRGNLAKNTYWPKYASVQPEPTLSSPVLLSAENITGGVKVTWQPVYGSEGYRVYRKVTGGSWERVAILSGNGAVVYTDTEVNSGTTYIYTVRACSGERISGYDSQKSVMYLKNPNVEKVNAVSGGVTVTWEKISGASGYCVYRKISGGKWARIATISSGNTVAYTDKTVSSGTTYIYTVRAYSENSMSSYDSQLSILYLKDPAIKGLSAVSGGVTITWEKIVGAKGYCVYRKTNSGGWSRIATITSGATVTYTDKSVSSGTAYTYTVRAYSGNGMSAYYDQRNIVYLSVPVLSSAEGMENEIKVTWKKVTGASGYYVYRKVSGGSWSRIASVGSGSTVTYTDKNVADGIAYIYTVRAIKGANISDYNRSGVTGKSLPSVIRYMTTEKVNYRTGPGTGYSVAGTLNKETIVKVVVNYSKKANGYTWFKIYLNGKYYYIISDYIKTIETYRYVTTEKVNYRTGPGTGYSVAGTLNKGVSVQVVPGEGTKANGYTWYKIYIDDKFYYISSSYLKKP